MSLYPLVQGYFELPIIVVMTLLYTVASLALLYDETKHMSAARRIRLRSFLDVFGEVEYALFALLHASLLVCVCLRVFLRHMEFLPLMVCSCVTAVAYTWSWWLMLRDVYDVHRFVQSYVIQEKGEDVDTDVAWKRRYEFEERGMVGNRKHMD